MEALENVAGGCDSYEYYCKSCGSTDISIEVDDFDYFYKRCRHCNSKNIGKRVVKEE